MKDLLPVIIVFVLIITGGFIFVSQSNSDSSQEASVIRSTAAEQLADDQATKLIVGNSDAPATIVEYFDYKCPSCNSFHQTTGKEINKAYVESGQVNYEIRMTPIIGPDSGNAARGAYCANEQNLFETYHETVIDFMFQNYYKDRNFSAEFDNILTTSRLSEITAAIGLDQAQFTSCTDSDRYNPNLDSNLNAAADDSIQGTPGFAIGEQTFVGGQPFSVFKTLLDIELSK